MTYLNLHLNDRTRAVFALLIMLSITFSMATVGGFEAGSGDAAIGACSSESAAAN